MVEKLINRKKVFFLVALFATNTAFADSMYIDPIQKEIDQKHDQMLPELKLKCQARNKISCLLEAQEKADYLEPNRGTYQYAEKAYSSLSITESKKKLRELINLYDKVKNQAPGEWEGKITKEGVEQETNWIMRHRLHQMSPDITSARLYLNMPVY